MPAQPADRADDARSDQTFRLTEAEAGSKCFAINGNIRQSERCLRYRVFEIKTEVAVLPAFNGLLLIFTEI